MKYAFNELAKYAVGLKDLGVDRVVERIEEAISEVEEVYEVGGELRHVEVARLVEVKPHPSKKNLLVTKVQTSVGVKTVVTAAFNVKPGMWVPFVQVGGKVPVNAYPDKFDGVIKPRKFGEITSEGMMLSELELGLGQDHSKIMELPSKYAGKQAKVGMSLSEYLDLTDTIIEIENKAITHRGDLFSLLGMAYELAGLFNLEFKKPGWWYSQGVSWQYKGVGPQLGELPPEVYRYNLVHAKWTNSPSPLEYKVLLYKHGIKSHSLIVDFTNYLLLVAGQPVHAFDLDKLLKLCKVAKPSDLVFGVRWSKEGETLVTISGEEKVFKKDQALLITCNNIPVAMAGVVGGAQTAVDINTKRVALEIANFSKYAVRRTMMATGVMTDAGVVFSRQQDPYKIDGVVKHIVDSTQAVDIVEKQNYDFKPSAVKVTIGYLQGFLNMPVEHSDIKALTRFGFTVKQAGPDTFQITAPTFRLDIGIPQDIAEEIVRIKGYSQVRLTPIVAAHTFATVVKDYQLSNSIRNYLKAKGLTEVINYSFVSAKDYTELGLSLADLYKITNAASQEVEYMRGFIVPQLVKVLNNNRLYTPNVEVFEVGKTFLKSLGKNREDVPYERLSLGMLLYDQFGNHDVFELKRILEGLFADLNLPNAYVTPLKKVEQGSLESMFNPYASGQIYVEDKPVGVIGLLKSSIWKGMGLAHPIVAAELDLTYIQDLWNQNHYKLGEVLEHPPVWEDLCFIVDASQPFIDLEKALQKGIQRAQKQVRNLHVSYFVLDIYYPPKERAVKHVTFRLRYVGLDRTLTDDEIAKVRQIIVGTVAQQVGAKLKTL